MQNRTNVEADGSDERFVTTQEVADLLGVSRRTVLLLPIKQYRIAERIIRYRLNDVYMYLAIMNPTP